VGVKLSAGQPLQIQVGLELGVELLVGGMVTVQLDDLSGRKVLRQRGCPTLQAVVGQQQWVAVLVNRTLCQPVDAASGLFLAAHAFEWDRLGPDAMAFARRCPDRR